jgi:hypothetical protein
VDPFAGYDWAEMLNQTECSTPPVPTDDPFHAKLQFRADITGDGRPEAFVIGRCPASTSTPPEILYVADGASRPGVPRLIARLGKGEVWRGVKATLTGSGAARRVVVTGPAVSAQSPLCCPDVRLTVRYRWTGKAFAEAGRTSVRLAG